MIASLRGRGQYVADIRLAGLQDVAFVRSSAGTRPDKGRPCAGAISRCRVHGRGSDRDQADPRRIRPARFQDLGTTCRSRPARCVTSANWCAMCVAPTRAEAEDIAASVTLNLEELAGRLRHAGRRVTPGTALVHEHWGDNVFLESAFEVDIAPAFDAPIKGHARDIDRAPMHVACSRGVASSPPSITASTSLTLYTGVPDAAHRSQRPVRLSAAWTQGRIRIVSPDVGGGFGYKGILLPEEVCLAWLTMHKGCAVRWIEDRREHLTASANCREHHYKITVYADRDGRLRGIDCEATVDPGAYSSYPFSACLEAAQVASILPGPYRMPAYRCRTFSVATNKCPILPYRGVARTGVCFALELMLDAVARRGRYRAAARCGCDNLVRPDADAVRQYHQQAFRQRRLSASACGARWRAIDIAAVRARQRTRRAGRPADRRRLVDLLRAGRARHVGVRRLGHSDGARTTNRPRRA